MKNYFKNQSIARWSTPLLFIGVALLVWVTCATLGKFEIVDERQHLIQIRMFLAGDYSLNPFITMFPGYHFLSAMIAQFLGVSSLTAFRFIGTLYGLLLLMATWYYLKDSRQPQYPRIQTLQIIATPIIWPFLWVVYTDVLATSAIVAMAALVQARHYKWAAFVGLLSLLIRQTNIIWVLLFWLIALHQENIVALMRSAFEQLLQRKKLRHYLETASIKKTLWFSVPLAVFIGFVYINHGIAIGDAGAHQIGRLHPTQIYFLLVVFWIVLLPLHVVNLKKIKNIFLRFPWIFIALVCIFLAIYLNTFEVTHQYNVGPSRYFLRNWLLNAMNDVLSIKLLAFPLIVWAALSLLVMQFKSEEMHWLYPFTIASLLPVSLIEQRYYMISFVLLMLFRVPLNRKVELALLAWLSILSFFLTRSIYSGRHFL